MTTAPCDWSRLLPGSCSSLASPSTRYIDSSIVCEARSDWSLVGSEATGSCSNCLEVWFAVTSWSEGTSSLNRSTTSFLHIKAWSEVLPLRSPPPLIRGSLRSLRCSPDRDFQFELLYPSSIDLGQGISFDIALGILSLIHIGLGINSVNCYIYLDLFDSYGIYILLSPA